MASGTSLFNIKIKMPRRRRLKGLKFNYEAEHPVFSHTGNIYTCTPYEEVEQNMKELRKSAKKPSRKKAAR